MSSPLWNISLVPKLATSILTGAVLWYYTIKPRTDRTLSTQYTSSNTEDELSSSTTSTDDTSDTFQHTSSSTTGDVLTCPYASSLSSPTLKASTFPPYTSAQLLAWTEQSPTSRLISLKGHIFDVSTDTRFQTHGTWAHAIGRDMTRAFALGLENDVSFFNRYYNLSSSSSSTPSSSSSSSSSSFSSSTALFGLNFDQLQRLETWTHYFLTHFKQVGVLVEDIEKQQLIQQTLQLSQHAFQTSSQHTSPPPHITTSSTQQDLTTQYNIDEDIQAIVATYPFLHYQHGQTQSQEERYASDLYPTMLPSHEKSSNPIHILFDEDEENKLCEYLNTSSSIPSSTLNEICGRSSMAPLHKAVEKGWPEVVSRLLSLGADTTVTCALYDNDTPLKLAERFQMHEIADILKKHSH